LDAAALEALRANFRGELIDGGHVRYDQARSVWNKRVDRRPALIARCTGVADVLQALRFARQQDAVVATNRRKGRRLLRPGQDGQAHRPQARWTRPTSSG